MSVRGEPECADLEERETLFIQAYPLARRAAQVRAATIVGLDIVLFDREDLVQEALMGLWSALPRYDGSRSSLRTYSERIATTTVASTLRRGKAKKRTARRDVVSAVGTVEVSVRIERRVDLYSALGKLDRSDGMVARLLLDECRPTEIAKTLRISRQAVYRSLDRIRLALQHSGFMKL